MKILKYLTATLLFALIVPYSVAQEEQQKQKENKHVIHEQPQGGNTDAQLRSSYAAAVAKRDALEIRINSLTREINTAIKKSKVRKAEKELVKTQAEYDAVVRLISSYPQYITNPNYGVVENLYEDERSKLDEEMDEKLNQRLEEYDFEREQIEEIEDPELKKLYENYFEYGDTKNPEEVAKVDPSFYFSVQIGSGGAGRAKYFRGVSDVLEVSLSGNTSAYHVGRYATEQEANQARNTIRANTQYKDAFVIAVSDGRKISLAEARKR